MNAGDVVAFKQPAADEVGLRFTVIELRGDRVMVRHDDSIMSIKPTFVYPVTDMVRIA